jgi:hypothetical protein
MGGKMRYGENGGSPMGRREPTLETVYTDIEWEEDEVTHPEPVAAPPVPRAVTPPPAPAAAGAEQVARLRKVIEFAQWERVAMVRFGIASAAWAASSCEPTPIFSRKPGGAAAGDDVDEIRRTLERAQEIVKGNHEALQKALDDLGRSLKLTDGDWI